MKILHLTLKREWFDMIASGEKKEEYRDAVNSDFWCKRFCNKNWRAYEIEILEKAIDKHFDIVHFYNGGSPCLKYPNFKIECKGISIGKAKPEWSDNWQGEVFIIKLGKIITKPENFK